jgi:OOP family OmpA-OmpF porin
VKKTTISLALLAALSAMAGSQAYAANDGYWVDSTGQIVRTGFGECWHTINWTADMAVPGCDGYVAKVAPKPAPVVVAPPPPAPAPVVVKAPEPAPAPAPVVVPEPVPVVVATPAPAPVAKPIPVETWKTILTAKPVRLEGANFSSGSAKLLKGADAKLEEVVVASKQHPEIKLAVSGHTDNRGKKETNQKLSTERADAVKAWLVKHGVAADRISAAGYADTQPIADNNTKEGQASNRRIEVSYEIREEKKVRVTE